MVTEEGNGELPGELENGSNVVASTFGGGSLISLLSFSFNFVFPYPRRFWMATIRFIAREDFTKYPVKPRWSSLLSLDIFHTHGIDT